MAGRFTVGELVAYLTLDKTNYDKNMTEAEKSAAKVESANAKLSKGGLVAAGALTAIGYAAYEAANRASDYADQIKEVATITGMSTDQVQRWKYAADQSGVSFEALTVTMRMLTQNIQGVDDKSSSLRTGLDSIGVSAKDANGAFKDTNTLMLETLTALKNMDDPIKRNTIAMQLYGRSWSELADFMEKDVELSTLLAKADPISKAKLDAAENYKNKMGALNAQLDQITISIGTKLMPAFNAIANWFVNIGVPAISFFIDKVSQGIVNMGILAARSNDAIARSINILTLGRANLPTNSEEQYNAQLLAELQATNASNSGSFSPGSSDVSTSVSGIGGGSSVFGTSVGTSSNGGSSPSLSAGTNLNSSSATAAMAAIARGAATGNPSMIMWGANQMKKVVSGNPYANNDVGHPEMGTIDRSTVAGISNLSSGYTAGSKYTLEDKAAFESSMSDTSGISDEIAWQQLQSNPQLGSIENAKRYLAWATPLQRANASFNGTQVGDWFELQRGMANAGQVATPVASVDAPTVSDYGTSFGGYTSSGAIKSNYQMGITQNGNGTLTVNLTLDGKVIAQSVVENLSSLGVKV